MSEVPAVTVGVRYCGGCNPRYDRVDFARALAAACPEARLEPARPGCRYDRLLVICGCSARCAGHGGPDCAGSVLVADHQTGLDQAADFIRRGIAHAPSGSVI